MSKIVLILTATSVGLGLTSLHLVKQLRDSQARVDQLQSEVASLRKPRPDPDSPAFASFGMPQASDPVEPSSGEASPRDKPTTSSDVARVAAIQPVAGFALPSHLSREEGLRMMREQRERQQQLMQDPEYREAMRIQSRSNLARQYPGVIQELGLDHQQAEEFFDMLAEQQLRTSERMQPLWDGSVDPYDTAAMQERHRKVQQMQAEVQRENEAELAARFGPDKLQAWKEYQSTVGQRYQLEHMRNTLAAQGLPLSEDVTKPMLKALAAAQKAEMGEHSTMVNRLRPGPGVAMMATRTGNSLTWDGSVLEQQLEATKLRNQRTLDAISPYLTYEQRKAIEREQEAQLKMQEAQIRIMRARGDGMQSSELSSVNTQAIVVQ